jgi:hypothetical protein
MTNGESPIREIEHVAAAHASAVNRLSRSQPSRVGRTRCCRFEPHHVGRIGTCVAETRPFSRFSRGERWVESEGLGTFNKLDHTTLLFSIASNGGEGGIRTHVPFRTRRFRGAPVTTTSVPLRLDLSSICKFPNATRLSSLVSLHETAQTRQDNLFILPRTALPVPFSRKAPKVAAEDDEWTAYVPGSVLARRSSKNS